MALVVLALAEEARLDCAAQGRIEIPANNSADDVSSIGLGERSAETAIVIEVITSGENAAQSADRILSAAIDVAAGYGAGLID